ncbi:MAG TPA: hypothetical protein ENJ37_09395 [Deltaproteobacteria bacterium]|nr:hypothetical protein [Deltaproteobacteria bacterium]
MSSGGGERSMRCPQCGGALKEVFQEAIYGRVLLLDQCGGCGGVWFDKWELLLLTEKAAAELEAVDLKALRTARAHRAGDGKCPRCLYRDLKVFNDPNLPDDASIKRCPVCCGLWLNRGEMTRYARFRAEKTAALGKGARRKNMILADRPGGPPEKGAPLVKEADLHTLRRLQRAIKPMGVDGGAADHDPPAPREVLRDGAWIVLQSLVRYFW